MKAYLYYRHKLLQTTTFKITHVFFQWMIFNLNRLRKEIHGLLRNAFNSIKEINRLKKEVNRLLSKGKPSIYLNVTYVYLRRSETPIFWV